MLLLIDVGNTNIVFGVYKDNKQVGSFRLTSNVTRTSDELGLNACAYFQRFGLNPCQVQDVIICSVVPGIMHALTNAIIKYFGRVPLVVNEHVFPTLKYPEGVDPYALGADRSVACMAAVEKYGAPLLVLDFGTATTLDAIDPDGCYRGGCILAGVQISINALFQRTAQLPQIELAVPDTFLGMDTVSQIQIGGVLGYIGSVEYLIRNTKKELKGGDNAKVVATGGLARLISENTDTIDVVDGGLILDGLVSIYEKYQAEKDKPGVAPPQTSEWHSKRCAILFFIILFSVIICYTKLVSLWMEEPRHGPLHAIRNPAAKQLSQFDLIAGGTDESAYLLSNWRPRSSHGSPRLRRDAGGSTARSAEGGHHPLLVGQRYQPALSG